MTANISGYTVVSEQVLGWFPLTLRLIVEDKPSEVSCVSVVQEAQWVEKETLEMCSTLEEENETLQKKVITS